MYKKCLTFYTRIIIINNVIRTNGGGQMENKENNINTKRYNISLMEKDMDFLKALAEEKNLTTSYLLTQIIEQFRTVGICDIESIKKHEGKRKAKLNV